MSIIPKVASTMQTILHDCANQGGKDTEFIHRQRKLSGSLFVQTVVFSWLANPQATYSEMSQTAAVLGVDLTSQAIESRFTEPAAQTLKEVLKGAVEQVIRSQPSVIPIVSRFNRVYLHDSSSIQLPDSFAKEFAGCGRSTEKSGLGMTI